MGLVIEPFDEIQVWFKGTGACLWVSVSPVTHPAGSIVGIVTTEPCPSTIALVDPLIKVAPTYRNHKLGRNATVVIPRDVIEVIFGDDRHFEEHG